MAQFLNALAEMALGITSRKIRPVFSSYAINPLFNSIKSDNLLSDNTCQLLESPSSGIELANDIHQQPVAETEAEFSQLINKEFKHKASNAQETSTHQSKANIKNLWQQNFNYSSQSSINTDEANLQEQTKTIDNPLTTKLVNNQADIQPKENFQSSKIIHTQIKPHESNQKKEAKMSMQQFNTIPPNEHTKFKSVEQVENNHLIVSQPQKDNHLIPQAVSVIHNKSIELQEPKNSTKNLSNSEAIKENAILAISQDLQLNDSKTHKSFLFGTGKNTLQAHTNRDTLQDINFAEDFSTQKISIHQTKQIVQNHKNLQLLDTVQAHPKQHFLNINKLPKTLPKIKITIQRLHIRALNKPKLIPQRKTSQTQSLTLLDYLDQSRQGASKV